VVWSEGPRRGDIYRIVENAQGATPLSRTAFLARIDAFLASLEQSGDREQVRELVHFIRDQYFQRPGYAGWETGRFLPHGEADKWDALLTEVAASDPKSPTARWLYNRADALGLERARDVLGKGLWMFGMHRDPEFFGDTSRPGERRTSGPIKFFHLTST